MNQSEDREGKEVNGEKNMGQVIQRETALDFINLFSKEISVTNCMKVCLSIASKLFVPH